MHRRCLLTHTATIGQNTHPGPDDTPLILATLLKPDQVLTTGQRNNPYAELRQLRAKGKPGGTLLSRTAPRQFHLLAKPTGAICNLDCTYCFFLSKEMLYPGSRFRMADDLLETYLRQLIEAHTGAPEVVVAWQGGEPTMMGLGFSAGR
jgi:hypothetical protein